VKGTWHKYVMNLFALFKSSYGKMFLPQIYAYGQHKTMVNCGSKTA
jgi:hypothetical protein